MNANSIRFDLSPYLIHFFRRLDLSSADITFAPEEWGPGDIVEDHVLSPVFLLRNAVRLRRLWATWSFRNGSRTIYGPHPSVCFTDMPVAAFIQAGRERQAMGQAMSPIALVLPRAQLLAAGARPAIYGLSGNHKLPAGKGGGERLMLDTALRADEQYRYVTLSENGAIDWMHEREWRWPYRGKLLEADEDGIPLATGADIPGLDLDFTGMGTIVSTDAQAKKVLHDILLQADRGSPGVYDFILVGACVKDLKVLVDPKDVQAALASSAIELAPYRIMAKIKRKALIAAFEACIVSIDHKGIIVDGYEHGACWLWLTDIMHDMARALVLEQRVVINKEGRYLVAIDGFDPELALCVRQELTRRLAKVLYEQHGLAASYHSTPNEFHPDALPYYADPPFENDHLFNYGNDKADY